MAKMIQALRIVQLYYLLKLTMGCVYHDYCIIGAGPSGLQLGYFLKSTSRDYVVFERNNVSGSFFQLYPRHRKLISLNKRNTGKLNKEFSLRHDWNSLLSDDEDLLATKYSRDIFPHADVLLRYLNDYQRKLNISVQFNTNIHNIKTVTNQTSPDGHVFSMEDQNGRCYVCRTLIVATGVSTPNVPQIPGIELTNGYESMSLDPEDYEGKTVLILGRGNSAFEIADSIYGHTNLIHMMGRSRVRLAWSTHYVGDLRAVNNALLDTYQLKSLDGLFESPIDIMTLEKRGNKIFIAPRDYAPLEIFDNWDQRSGYDVVIRALGFKFDNSLFFNTSISRGVGRAQKYPAIHHNYESKDHRGLFYTGTASHSLDFKKSSGGFIHGFRYTARALHRLMEWRYEGKPWPSTSLPNDQLLTLLIKRINEAAGPYQMFQMLGDVAIFSENGDSFKYIEEYPIYLLHELPQRTGHNGSAYMVMVMQYGHDFSGPGKDVFRESRSTLEPSEAHTSNFLHPVFYFYSSIPTEATMRSKSEAEVLPRPDFIHHVVEDFYAEWDRSHSHILPLRRFLENIFNTDLRAFYSESCFLLGMTHDSLPENCQNHYLQGQGLYGTSHMKMSSSSHGLLIHI